MAGLTWFKLYMHLAQTDDDIWVEAVSRTPDLNALFHDATSRALPDVGSRDVRLRVIFDGALLSAPGMGNQSSWPGDIYTVSPFCWV